MREVFRRKSKSKVNPFLTVSMTTISRSCFLYTLLDRFRSVHLKHLSVERDYACASERESEICWNLCANSDEFHSEIGELFVD